MRLPSHSRTVRSVPASRPAWQAWQLLPPVCRGITFEWDNAVALRRCGQSLQQLRIGPPHLTGQGGRCRLPSGAAGALRSLRQLTALQLRWVGGWKSGALAGP